MEIAVNLYSPLHGATPDRIPLARTLLVNLEQTAFAFGTQLPVGFGALSLGIPLRGGNGQPLGPAYLPQRVSEIVPFAHVEVRLGGSVLWEGQIVGDELVGGEPVGFQGEGYGASTANADTTLIFSSADPVAAAEMLSAVLAQGQPYLRLAPWSEDPGITHVPVEFHDLTPGEAIDKIVTAGGEAPYYLWDFVAWEGRQAALVPRREPSAPEWRMPLDERVRTVRDFRQLYGEVSAEYTPVGGGDATRPTLPAADSSFRDRYGRHRRTVIRGGEMTESGALAWQQTTLTRLRLPLEQTTLTIPFGSGLGLERVGGGVSAPWLVRAGQWVQLGRSAPQIITGTSCDFRSQTLTVTLGEAVASQPQAAHRLEQFRKKVMNRINPASGGRER